MRDTSIHTTTQRLPYGIGFAGAALKESSPILSHAALKFIAKLEREFRDRRKALLRMRQERLVEINSGRMPNFLPETEHVRASYWRVAATPAQLLDRRVEILAPPTADAIGEAMNSHANTLIADLEDSTSPTWHNILQGHSNLHDYFHGTSVGGSVVSPALPAFAQQKPIILCPRGWHAEEKHLLVDGKPVSASLFDFGLYLITNIEIMNRLGVPPNFYLPKIENRFEAALWNEVFLMAQDEFGFPRGSIKATVIIESILAAFEMHEILYELRDHCVGLACGRWNYISSFIRTFRRHPEFILHDRSRLTMLMHFLRSFSLLLIQTSHKRGALAIGGTTALNPIDANGGMSDEIIRRIRADKEREAEDGHDGTWETHPASVAIAKEVFDGVLRGPNQTNRKRDDLRITSDDILSIHRGDISDQGIRANVSVALDYLAGWLGGKGVVERKDTIEIGCTAEIARAQLWQWIHQGGVRRGDGLKISEDFLHRIEDDELKRLLSFERSSEVMTNYTKAKTILDSMVLDNDFVDHFTTAAYVHLD